MASLVDSLPNRLEAAAGAATIVRACAEAVSRPKAPLAAEALAGRTPSDNFLNLPNSFPPRFASIPRASGVMAWNEVGGSVVEDATVELVASRFGAENAEASSTAPPAPPDESVSL